MSAHDRVAETTVDRTGTALAHCRPPAEQPQNLILWAMNSQLIEPRTVMPERDVSEQQARDAAAYSYTLH
jgi:hypothetical protein